MTTVTEDVKPSTDGILQSQNIGLAPPIVAEPLLMSGPDLVTLEDQKREAQKTVGEQESFLSWFCFRCCFDCCYCPGPGVHCGTSGSDTVLCCQCCCGNPDCSCSGECCNGAGECCTGCGECCTGCLVAGEPCLAVGEGMGACCSSC